MEKKGKFVVLQSYLTIAAEAHFDNLTTKKRQKDKTKVCIYPLHYNIINHSGDKKGFTHTHTHSSVSPFSGIMMCLLLAHITNAFFSRAFRSQRITAINKLHYSMVDYVERKKRISSSPFASFGFLSTCSACLFFANWLSALPCLKNLTQTAAAAVTALLK